MFSIPGLALALAIAATTSVHADLVGYWNFNGLSITTASPPGTGGVPLSISADQGAGTLDLSSWTGLVDDFGGTTINALGMDPAGASLSLVGNGGNGSWIDFDVSLAGLMDPILTFATRGTSTGFDSGIWSWSTDGVTFNAVAGNTATRVTTFDLATIDLTGVSGLTNASSVTFRYTLSGATSTAGNNRIDNFQINASTASAVPEPGTAGLIGLVFVGIACRRRRA
jgi:hypothetical protein